MSRPLAARKQMRLSFIQEGKPLLVRLDALKMSKVFNNLIENAIQYCQPGARIEVRLSRGEDAVLVSVSDNGPGIDPTDLRTLFTPFQKTRSREATSDPIQHRPGPCHREAHRGPPWRADLGEQRSWERHNILRVFACGD